MHESIHCFNGSTSIILRDTPHEAEACHGNGPGGLPFMEYLLLGLQPVFESMAAILSTLLK
jgi:hypothetical protein